MTEPLPKTPVHLRERRSFMALAVVPMLGLASARGAADPAQAKRVRVGFLKDYQPFSFMAGAGTVQGFDVAVAQRIAERMSVQLEPVVDNLAGLTQRLQQGDVAWLGNQLLASVENRRQFDLVRPAYASIQLCAIQHEDDPRDFLSLEDLLGQRLGVLAGTGVEEQARGVLGQRVRGYLHIEQALRDLADKQLDVVLEENLVVDYHIEKDHWPLRVGAPFAAPVAVGLAVRKGDAARAAQLSAAVTALLQDGSLAQIAQHWFGYDVSRTRVSHSR